MKIRSMILLSSALPFSAYAHHPMGGNTPDSIMQGILSGLGHPIIEIDHLLFVIGFACLLALCSRHILAHLGLFLGIAIAGTFGRLLFPEIHFFEAGIFITTVLTGVLLTAQRLDRTQLIWALAPAAGFFHGYAYGEAIIGAESTPLLAYLFGFSLIQAALVWGVVAGLRRLTANHVAANLSGYRTLAGIALVGLACIF